MLWLLPGGGGTSCRIRLCRHDQCSTVLGGQRVRGRAGDGGSGVLVLVRGGKQLAIAYLPSLGRFLHSICQIFSFVDLECLRALEQDTLYSVCRSLWVASLASVSALLLPLMRQWLGHHAILIVSLLWVSYMGLSVLWNPVANTCATCGLGSVIARTTAALSVKNVI